MATSSSASGSHSSIRAPLLLAAGALLAVGAQLMVAGGNPAGGAALYAVAAAGVIAALAGERAPEPSPAATARPLLPRGWRAGLAVAAGLAGLGAFALSEGNRYRPEGVLCWLAGVACWLLAWWELRQPASGGAGSGGRWRQAGIAAALLALLALGAAFRFAELADNPRDMNSDQAEKLLDVKDVIDGTPHIFFERNTGREPWQFYWTVALIKLFNLPQDFMALKLGTALIGWLTLPAVFLLAREVFGTRTALVATLFAAVASWGVITARFGLRYPLAPCAAAWTMACLARGLRRGDRNAMLMAGVWLGIGLQGYSAYRFMLGVAPAIGMAWAGWAWLRGQRGAAGRALGDGALALAAAMLVLAPLLRYGAERPDELFYRAATRLSDQEQPIPGNPAAIFADNLKNVLLMFNVTRDEVWVANLPDRPAMDDVLGALLAVGAVAAAVLSARRRDPWPAMILAAGILMLIPSALSLAFPRENPSVVRAGGALPMLMTVCAIVPGCLLERLGGPSADQKMRRAAGAGAAVAIGLCGAIVLLNYERVFVAYPMQYCPRAQNASDIAREMDAWVAQGHARENAYLVGFPHWVDSRAVGVWIGDITFPRTVGAQVGQLDAAQVDLGGQPGWFALSENDAESLAGLVAKYPRGRFRVVEGSLCAERRFVVFTTD